MAQLREDNRPKAAAFTALTLLLLWLTACLPPPREEEPYVPPKPDARSDAKADTAAADTTADGAADSLVGASDVEQTDTQTPDADPADTELADTDPADVEPADGTPGGCTSNDDCKDLPFGACKVGVCNTKTGLCIGTPGDEGNPCNAGPCFGPGTCSAGTCSATPKVCDDANVCTSDFCSPSFGCQHQPQTVPCDDGNTCTSDTCDNGVCKGAIKSCNDNNPCTDDSCNSKTGQCNNVGFTKASKQVSCAAGGDCVTGGLCDAGKCVGQNACEDNNACTLDVCKSGSCEHLALLGACGTDKCNPGTCALEAGATTPTCVQKPLCVDKTCLIAGCTNGQCTYDKIDDQSSCDDGDPCTGAGSCVKGVCKAGAAGQTDCNDGNPCTKDGCDPLLGCTATAVDAGCSDNNGCTENDFCKDGVCAGTPVQCLDGNPCTIDACSGSQGCTHTIAPDGSSCGNGQSCKGGACVKQ